MNNEKPLNPDDLHGLESLFEDGTACLVSMLEGIESLIGFEKGSVYLSGGGNGNFSCEASRGMSLREVKTGERLLSQVYRPVLSSARAPILLQNPEWDSRGGKKAGDLLLAPLRSNGRLSGVMALSGADGSHYGDRELRLASLVAGHMALAIENRRLRAAVAFGPKADLLENAEVPCFSVALDGRIVKSNRALMDLLGIRNDRELAALNFRRDVLPRDADGAAAGRRIDRGMPFETPEIRIRRRDGSVIPVRFWGAPLDEDGVVIGHECVAKDLSARRDLEEQLFHCQKMASLGQLTSNIAHDFNNLLSGVMGCASLMLAQIEPGHPMVEDANTILSASRKAADLAGHLLDYARHENEQIRPVSVNGLVTETVKMLSCTFDKSVRIRASLFPGLAAVKADAARVQQVIMNLCLNARDAMPGGGTLTIRTANEVLSGRDAEAFGVKPGAFVRIRIKDTGCGMNRETLDRIFMPFFTTKGPDKGNGLGLSIALETVRSHRGGIRVSSRPGRGATFDIALPAFGGHSIEAVDPEDSVEKLPRGRETLLFVDDEEVIRRMGKRMLEKYGYSVLMAKDGEDALRLVRSPDSKIDLVIVDKILPRMDGSETLKRIRSLKPGIKALLTSGYWTGDPAEGLSDGFCGFIPKPFLMGQMLRIIRQSLDNPAHAMPQ
jgi:PAS domain S-box-containing protein